MRIAVTADLHFEVPRSTAPAEEMARTLSTRDADVLILAGDTAALSGDLMRRSLLRFEAFAGPKFLVAGNHDLWTFQGDSNRVYEEIGRIARDCGFHFLDEAPATVDGVGFVGNIGWYDYSFAKPALGIPRRFYEAKVSPGAAAMLPAHRHLIDGFPDDPPSDRALQIRARWRDGERVRLGRTDEQFLGDCLARLEGHLRSIEGDVRTIVATVHHLPFAELVPEHGVDRWDFAAAYLGSPLIGELLLRHPKVKWAFCGHSHHEARTVRGPLTCINVGSSYTLKRFVEIALE